MSDHLEIRVVSMDGGSIGVTPFFHCSADAWQHAALHDGAALVVLDVATPHTPVKCDILGEGLLLEETNGVVACIRQRRSPLRKEVRR